MKIFPFARHTPTDSVTRSALSIRREASTVASVSSVAMLMQSRYAARIGRRPERPSPSAFVQRCWMRFTSLRVAPVAVTVRTFSSAIDSTVSCAKRDSEKVARRKRTAVRTLLMRN